MAGLDKSEIIFIVSAYVFQLILITHFALRKWHFGLAIRFGPVVYGLSIPAALASLVLLISGKEWYFGISGFIYLVWAVYGFYVEYIRKIEWRNPPYWPILGPFVTLYLTTVMFYWWPLALIYKPLWYGSAVLFLVSTYLNITSHRKGKVNILNAPSGEAEPAVAK